MFSMFSIQIMFINMSINHRRYLLLEADMGSVLMSKQECRRMEVMSRVREGKFTMLKAAEHLESEHDITVVVETPRQWLTADPDGACDGLSERGAHPGNQPSSEGAGGARRTTARRKERTTKYS